MSLSHDLAENQHLKACNTMQNLQHYLIQEYLNHCKTTEWVENEVYKFLFAHYIHDKVNWDKQTDEEILEILQNSQKIKYPDSVGYGIQFIQVSSKTKKGDSINLSDVQAFRRFRIEGFDSIDPAKLSMSYTVLSAWLASLFPNQYYPAPLKGYDETIQYFFDAEIENFYKIGPRYIEACQPYLQRTEEYLRDYNFPDLFLETIQSFFRENESFGIVPKTKFTKLDWVWMTQDFHLFLLRTVVSPKQDKKQSSGFIKSDATKFSTTTWLEILQNSKITKEVDLKILKTIYRKPKQEASSKEIGLSLGFNGTAPHATVNLEVGRFAKRIAQHYDIDFSERINRKHKFWDLFFRGYYSGAKFIWQLKPELAEALNQLIEASEVNLFPEEISGQEISLISEGARKTITVNRYERSTAARQECIDHWGMTCSVCNFDFKQRYGVIGEGFIHVHHLTPLSLIGEEYQINPINDLRPVCPNCHAILHKRNPPFTIEELKHLLE